MQWQIPTSTQEAEADITDIVNNWIIQYASSILFRATRDYNGALSMQSFLAVPVTTSSSLKQSECHVPCSSQHSALSGLQSTLQTCAAQMTVTDIASLTGSL